MTIEAKNLYKEFPRYAPKIGAVEIRNLGDHILPIFRSWIPDLRKKVLVIINEYEDRGEISFYFLLDTKRPPDIQHNRDYQHTPEDTAERAQYIVEVNESRGHYDKQPFIVIDKPIRVGHASVMHICRSGVPAEEVEQIQLDWAGRLRYYKTELEERNFAKDDVIGVTFL